MALQSVRVDQHNSQNRGALADIQEVSKESLDIVGLLRWLTVKFLV